MTRQILYKLRVVGEGRVRAKGVLAFIVPQALDLVSRSQYTVSISLAEEPTPGALHLRNTGATITARYTRNMNLPNPGIEPTWLDAVTTMSESLGKKLTWPTQT